MRTRILRLFPVLFAVLLLGATEVYAQTATVVTQSGQRLRGQIVSMGMNNGYSNGNDYGDTVVMRIAGRQRRIPANEVAFIDFVGDGTIPQNELNRANRSNNGLVVLRNGRTLNGSLADFNVPMGQVARVYFGNGPSNQYPMGTNGQGGYNPNYDQNGQNEPRYGGGRYNQSNGPRRTVTMPTNQTWTNSGVDVRAGEVVHFQARGTTTLSQNPNDSGTPAGANDGRMAGNSPIPGVTGGMLIGRVGNSQPFAIGAQTDVTMPATGRLFLGVNDDFVGDNVGSFVVDISPR